MRLYFKAIIITILLCLISEILLAQLSNNNAFSDQEFASPYQLELSQELAFLAIGVAGKWGSEVIIENLDPFTLEELAALDPNDVNAFDRSATDQYSIGARTASDVVRNGSYALPLLLFFDKRMGKNWKQILLLSGEAWLINESLTSLTKGIFARNRPLAYNENVPIVERTAINAKLSFFSGHVSATAVMSFVTAKLFSDFYPDSPLRPFMWSGACALTAATGYFRYKGGKHFYSDVIVGGAVGALIGILTPQLHKSKTKVGEATLSFITASGDAGLVLRW